MNWIHRCPRCLEFHSVDWMDRIYRQECPKTGELYIVPYPIDKLQAQSYFDSYNWPQEMIDAVIKKKGKKCTVPGCDYVYDTLDHRIPWPGGQTSLENLWPMCNKHKDLKGNSEYHNWLLDMGIKE